MSREQTGIKKELIIKNIFRVKEIGIMIPTILLIIIVQMVNPLFLTKLNVLSILRSSGYMLIPALGMTLILISGGLDLSVGSVYGLGGVVTAYCLTNGLPIVPSVLLGLLSGMACGILNGVVIVKLKIPPIMMTLGMYYMARGLVYVITQGTPIFPLPEAFKAIEQRNIILGIPTAVVCAMILAAVFFIIMRYTVYGRKIYAIGGNIETARVAGINIDAIMISLYAIIGTLSALDGVLMSSRLGSGQPSAGTGYELQVIAAVVIGGTSTYGGKGTLAGTVIGVIFMNILSSSMTIMKISAYWQNFVIGAALVVAVIIDQIKRSKTAED
ncbi:ABC transporter permease [Lactonifactor longoviformis]|uniref:ABC transporter permease n=1 Tax=Lactonifactor longoviformis TaxID=341220 RepID=UPI001D0222FA|nr:ABC transporter permease [Lactonifactor longoviformis]MCB5712525.1 ABC transporter permease [Lactonifactor longoviformis]MCB5716568.1 ABC transporter permease [Lactonifactor longoviformis]